MVYLRLSHVFTAIAGFSSLCGVFTAPLEAPSDLASRDVPGAPHFVIYGDKYVPGQTGPPPVDQINGWNVFALSFLMTIGPVDKALEWTQLTAAQRSSIKQQYQTAGIKLIVSAFGSTDTPTTNGVDPVGTANTMAAWVKQYSLDGIDVDYEDFQAMNAGDGKAEAWLASFTQELRNQLPQGQYIVTHAPVAPWFSPQRWGGGGYLKVHQTVGNLIDWYNIQFYNQGASEYSTCYGLLYKSSSTWPSTSLFEIKASGVDQSKLVIGKPETSADANNGFMTPETLAQCVQQAKNQGWNAGVMTWQFDTGSSPWIQTVRAQTFP